MLSTEEEATKRWCPVIRFVIGQDSHRWQGNAYTNRADDFGPRATTCVGSQCMWWRWGKAGTLLYSLNSAETRVVQPGQIYDGSKWAAGGDAQSTTHGYCGAAGKP